MPERGPSYKIDNMPAEQYDLFGVSVLADASLWKRYPGVEEQFLANPAKRWSILFETSRVFTHEENVTHAQEIRSLQSQIDAYVATHAINLSAVFSGEASMDSTLAGLFQQHHVRAVLMAQGNISLLQTAARQIEEFYELSPSAKAEIYSAGYDGLVLAAKRFDPWFNAPVDASKDIKSARRFSTVAVSTAYGKMMREYRKFRNIIAVPEYAQAIMGDYQEIRDMLSQLPNRHEITIDHEVACLLFKQKNGRNPKESEVDRALIDYAETTEFVRMYTKISDILRAQEVMSAQEEHSLTPRKPVDEDTHHVFEASIEDTIADDDLTEDLYEEKHRKILVARAIALLPAREARVIELRYGFKGEPNTREEIARKIGVTTERVRQIEAQALAHLRTPRTRRDLADWK